MFDETESEIISSTLLNSEISRCTPVPIHYTLHTA